MPVASAMWLLATMIAQAPGTSSAESLVVVAREGPDSALVARARERRDRRRDQFDADVERHRRNELRCQLRHQQPAAAGLDRSERGVVLALDTGARHDVLLADRRQQRRRIDGRCCLVVHHACAAGHAGIAEPD